MRKYYFQIISIIILLLAPVAAKTQTTYASHSRLAEGNWYKIAISTDGMYQLTTADIAALNGCEINRIAIYASLSGMIPESRREQLTDDVQPVAISVVDQNGNGIFESDDYIVFYGESANIWRYNTRTQHFEYTPHAYANANYYYLTTNCLENDSRNRIATNNLTADGPLDITYYTAVALYHPENINTHGSGQIWVADKLTPSTNTRNYTLSLPSQPLNGNVVLRYGLANVSEHSGGQFTLRCGSNSQQEYMVNGVNYRTDNITLSNISSKDVQINLTYAPQSANADGYLDFLELNAQVPLTYQGGVLTLRNGTLPASGGNCKFVANGNMADGQIWDVTNPLQPSIVPTENNGNNRFTFVAPCSEARTFVAFTPNSLPHPGEINPIDNQDIHGTPVPDYVIVSHKDFTQQAEALADLHRMMEGLNVMVVTQEQVFNEFSSGKADPLAVRQMMRCLRAKDDEHVNPRYLLFFGKGTYDNRDIMGKHQRTVVTYQTPTSFDSEGSSFPSDDPAGYLNDSLIGIFEGKMSVSIGRLPAKTVAEAQHLVSKIERYMKRSDFEVESVRGDWRNYVTLLADDADPSCSSDTNFASDSEKMAQEIKRQYPHYNIDRIFADSYIQQSGADGSYYPDVNNALRQRINYGCLLLNYIGHGSSSYIGTERYMEFTDIEKYTNLHQLPLFITSTCSFGHYDLLDGICGAEAFLLADAAGIGVMSAARPIHHNHRFNTNCSLLALNPENTIGEALTKAKNITQVSHCIALFGDPALHLSVPKNNVVVTSVNNRAVDPSVTDSAQVLSRVTIEGEIRDKNGNIQPDFNGTIFPIVFDREVACRTLANDNDSTEVNFWQQKNMLYKGRETVTNGKFSYSFIIPRDVAYRYDFAKLSHYAQSDNDNATGQYGNLMFGGFNDEAELAEMHPQVQLFINDTNFRNGGITNETPTLYARLIDSVGINAAGSGLGHDITAIIDGNPYSTVTLNDYYEPSIRDSRNGEVYYTFGKLDEGEHSLTLKCWNIFNYSGSATIRFRVVNDRIGKVGQLSATPNPAHDRTLIRLEHNLTNNIGQATVSIYDIRGSLVRQFTPHIADNGCVLAIAWDFTADNGNKVGKGIYIVRADITTTNGERHTQTSKIVRN